MPDLLARRLWDGSDERRRRDDLAGRAEAALERVGADEGVDERVVAESFDRRHLAGADGVDERDAREHGHPVQLDGAGATVALAAGDLRARQAEVVAEGLGERPPDGCIERVVVSVDAQLRHRP